VHSAALPPLAVAPLQKEKEPTLQSRVHVDHRRRPMTSAKRAPPRHACRTVVEAVAAAWPFGETERQPPARARVWLMTQRVGGGEGRRKRTTSARIAPPDRLVVGRGAARGCARRKRSVAAHERRGVDQKSGRARLELHPAALPIPQPPVVRRHVRHGRRINRRQRRDTRHAPRAPRPRAGRVDGRDRSAATVVARVRQRGAPWAVWWRGERATAENSRRRRSAP